MPNRNRAAGDRFEYRVRDTLRSQGWVVSRSAGSQGAMDLVALKRGHPPLLVSCKINGRVDPWERDRLALVAHQAGAEAVIAYRSSPGVMGLDRLTPAGVREPVAAYVRMTARPGMTPAKARAAMRAGSDSTADTTAGDADPAGAAPPPLTPGDTSRDES